MKRFILTLLCAMIALGSIAQNAKNVLEIDQSSFRPVQTGTLKDVNIDPIGIDRSKRKYAQLKIRLNRMSREEIAALEVRLPGGMVELVRRNVAAEGNGLILELTAKPQTRLYLHHYKFGDSNEVTLNLEGDKVYIIDGQLNMLLPITISSNVKGADVYLDGVCRGAIGENYMCAIADVLHGTHTVKLVHGAATAECSIDVNSDNFLFRVEVNTATSRPQFVAFEVEPKSATVVIDGHSYKPQDGVILIMLLNGVYKWSACANGYHEQNGTLTVKDSKVMYKVNLQPISSTDSIQSGIISVHNSTKTYKVGDYYNDGKKEGVVFWVDPSGKHGKIVSLTESYKDWSSNKKEQKRLIGADDKVDGAKNMAVVKQIRDWESKYPAFKWCADLGEGWYLPAIDELKIFTLDNTVHDAVNRTLETKGEKLANKGDYHRYWSSTEYDYKYRSGEFCAWSVGMYYGRTNFNNKYYNYYVRAVSAF